MTRVSEKLPSAWSTGLSREKNEMLLAGNELNASHGHFRRAKFRHCSHIEIRQEKRMDVE